MRRNDSTILTSSVHLKVPLKHTFFELETGRPSVARNFYLNSVAAASPFFLTASACSTFLSRLYRREKEKIVTGKFRVKLTSNMRVIVEKQTYRKEEEVFYTRGGG